jgi:hypothetical protein
MWIFMNDSFVSIVADRDNPENLMVRARRKGDIERAFGVKGRFLQVSDYAYRASIPRQHVVDVIATNLHNVNYTNFKDSIPKRDHVRHSFYLRVWAVMAEFQPLRRRRKRDGDLNDTAYREFMEDGAAGDRDWFR